MVEGKEEETLEEVLLHSLILWCIEVNETLYAVMSQHNADNCLSFSISAIVLLYRFLKNKIGILYRMVS